jgi:hypothetical protein
MANLIDEAVKILMTDAGKTSSADRDLARARVKGVINDINKRVPQGVLRAEQTFSVTSGTHTYALEDNFGEMSVIGKYDSTGERISEEWTNIGDFRMMKRYEYLTASQASGTVRHWLFVSPDANLKTRIRLVPEPDSSFTGMYIYYARLDEQTVDRLGWVDPLVDGAMRKLPKWFPTMHLKAERHYLEDLKMLKKRPAGAIMADVRPHPEVQRANYWQRVIS